jgi:uncharacterized protein YcfJ
VNVLAEADVKLVGYLALGALVGALVGRYVSKDKSAGTIAGAGAGSLIGLWLSRIRY